MFRDALVSFTERRGIFMEIHELQQLLSEMSLQEKIGQMVQLTGVYFDKEAEQVLLGNSYHRNGLFNMPVQCLE